MQTATQHHQIDIDELFRQRDEYSRQAARMRVALKEIAGWRDDTLGARSKEKTKYDCPQAEIDAFDRGCRMAFYRCAERAQSALKD